MLSVRPVEIFLAGTGWFYLRQCRKASRSRRTPRVICDWNFRTVAATVCMNLKRVRLDRINPGTERRCIVVVLRL